MYFFDLLNKFEYSIFKQIAKRNKHATNARILHQKWKYDIFLWIGCQPGKHNTDHCLPRNTTKELIKHTREKHTGEKPNRSHANCIHVKQRDIMKVCRLRSVRPLQWVCRISDFWGIWENGAGTSERYAAITILGRKNSIIRVQAQCPRCPAE